MTRQTEDLHNAMHELATEALKRLSAEIEQLRNEADTADRNRASAIAENDRLHTALERSRAILHEKNRGTTHRQGCDEYHPDCAVLKLIATALTSSASAERCPYGVYAYKCKEYPECACGWHDKRAAEQRSAYSAADREELKP